MRQAISIELDGQYLHGTFHEGASPRKRGVLFLNSGAQPRSGRGDFNVGLADALALQGYPSFRFDLPGLGDSEGSLPSHYLAFAQFLIQGGYASCAVKLTRLLLETYQLEDIVLLGLCGGAITAVHAASSLTREELAGLVLLDVRFERYDNPSVPGAKGAGKKPFGSTVIARARLWRERIRGLVLKQRWAPRLVRFYLQARNMLRSVNKNQLPRDTNVDLMNLFFRLLSQRMPMLIFSARSPGPQPHSFDYIDYLRRSAKGTFQHMDLDDVGHSFVENGAPAVVQEAVLRWLSGNTLRTDGAGALGEPKREAPSCQSEQRV